MFKPIEAIILNSFQMSIVLSCFLLRLQSYEYISECRMQDDC